MRLYDNAYPSVYEELKTYYPVWYRDVLEMDAIWRISGKQLDGIRSGIIQAVENCFVRTADATTIAKLESFLYVTYDGPRTIDERRNVVATFYIGNGHVGRKEITEIVGTFTDGEIVVAFAGGVIDITVTPTATDQLRFSDCCIVLLKRIPAHLGLTFTSRTNFLSDQYRGGALTLVPRFSFIDTVPGSLDIESNQYHAPGVALTPRFQFKEPTQNTMNISSKAHGATALTMTQRMAVADSMHPEINLRGSSYHAGAITFKGGMNFGH